jgi:hypothetical protein
MDEDEIEIPVTPMRHDGWSVLIYGVSCASQLTQLLSNQLFRGSVMLAQHSMQVEYDRKFKEITRG